MFGGILSLLNELEVENILISSQGEVSNNYLELLDIASEKNINIIYLVRGNTIYFEDDIYMDILWPEEEQIQDNILNNNSLVAKLYYNDFTMLFTRRY